MKNKAYSLSLIFLGLAISFNAISQIPQGFNYQAVAHNTTGAVLPLTTLQVKASILSDTLTPVIVYEELHNPVRTNAGGVFSIVVGRGVRQAGSAASFSVIDWSKTPLYLKIQIYHQNVWKYMGTSKLWAVPYSMSSGTIAGGTSKFSIKGTEVSPDSALFIVKNKDGQTVFAVYNEGVRIYVDDGVAKGSKGGFAVGGFGTEKGTSQNLLTVSSDSVRIYVDETAAKGSKGGFAVGGFNAVKGTQNEFMFLTPENYFIGHMSGEAITTGTYNSTLGYEAGKSLTEGMNNIFIGYNTGKSTDVGSSNVFIGNNAGLNNLDGDYNIFIGRGAGWDNYSGWSNIIMGDYAGITNYSGYQNVMIGDFAGMSNYDGYHNVFVGADAGEENTSGSNNVFIGKSSGFNNTEGDYNTFIGFEAGYNSGLSSFSTSIGYKAGHSLSDWQAGTYLGYEAGLNSTGRQNVFLGAETGNAFTTGADNVVIGAGAGSSPVTPFTAATGSRNTLIGYYTGYKSSTATDNVIVGAQNPFSATNITGSYNVYLGVDAGNLSAAGARNVFIGYQAGKNETGSDKLYVHNSSSTSPLLWGDFNLRRLKFNANTGINSVPNQYFGLQIELDANDTYGLVVYGQTWCSSGVWAGSDIRLKKDVSLLNDALNKVRQLNGVNFYWNIEEHPEMGFSESKQIGLIAQDVEKVFPELVTEGPGGFKSVDYSKIAPILIEAIKDQQKQIDELKAEIELLKAK